MKQNNVNNTPAIKYIDGQPFVRVIDLGHIWNTNSSNILATGKPHHVPEEHLRRIDGRVWCSFKGLRYRMIATRRGSSITGHIREFLDAQAEKKPEPVQAQSEPAATDLGTAALIADARRTAANAIVQATDNAHRLDTLEKRAEEQENSGYRRMTRLHNVERRQGDNAIELTAVKEDVRFLEWSLAVVAVVRTVAGIMRMARRR